MTVTVPKEKTVSSNYLLRGNQTNINYLLLTQSESLRKVKDSQALWMAAFD